MPTFDIEYEFEAFCNVCGTGMCGNISIVQNNRKVPVIRIDPCENCNERFEEKIHDLEKEIKEKQKEIYSLEDDIENLEYELMDEKSKNENE